LCFFAIFVPAGNAEAQDDSNVADLNEAERFSPMSALLRLKE